MYVNYFEKQIKVSELSARTVKTFKEFYSNMVKGMDFLVSVAERNPNENENLASIQPMVEKESSRLEAIYQDMLKQAEQ